MKYLLVIAIALFSTQASIAQHHKGKKGMNFSPEDIASIKTKKMTLALDLTASQQDAIYNLNLEHVKNRKAEVAARKAQKENGEGKALTKEDRVARIHKALDRKIAAKAKLKTILNKAQYTKWETLQAKRYAKSRKHNDKRGHQHKA
jgi:hypothetical protein